LNVEAARGQVDAQRAGAPRRQFTASLLMIRLHVNIDHVATVRQARRTDEPDPVRAAVFAELGGADGITVHLREDRRHIQDRDVRLLIETVRTGVNLELAGESDVLALALELRPMEATLVPEKREEITTEGGLALADAAQRRKVAAAVQQLRAAGIRTSLFIDPAADVLRAAADMGVDAIELHTGEFAEAWKQRHSGPGRARVAEELERMRRAASQARALDLDVHAGHGLTYENVSQIASIEEIEELNIGHSIVSRALLVGFESAVSGMRSLIHEARHARAGE
jgi:pyridoxine 5-phosphate synthase